MQVAPEVLFAAAIAAIAFLVGVLYLRVRAKRTRSVGLRVAHGPANLRFTCAGCSGQFTHSRRTLAAWSKGTRRFYCNACHTKWQGSHPDRPPARGGSGPGCLGVVLLLMAVPAGLIAVLLHYA